MSRAFDIICIIVAAPVFGILLYQDWRGGLLTAGLVGGLIVGQHVACVGRHSRRWK